MANSYFIKNEFNIGHANFSTRYISWITFIKYTIMQSVGRKEAIFLKKG